MTTPHNHTFPNPQTPRRRPGNRGPVNLEKTPERAGHVDHSEHGGHSWMMIACCIPMLAIAIALVATGVASASFLLVAVMCTAMMALMMRGMHNS